MGMTAGAFSLLAVETSYFDAGRDRLLLDNMPGAVIAKIDGKTLYEKDTQKTMALWKGSLAPDELAKLANKGIPDKDIIANFPKSISPYGQEHGKLQQTSFLTADAAKKDKLDRVLIFYCPFCQSNLFALTFDSSNKDVAVTNCCKKKLYRKNYPADYDLKPNGSFKFQYLDNTKKEIPCVVYTSKDGITYDLFIEHLFSLNDWLNAGRQVVADMNAFMQTGDPIYPYKMAVLLDLVADTYYSLPLSHDNTIFQGVDGKGFTRADWEKPREPNYFQATELGTWNRRSPIQNRGWLNMLAEPIWIEPYARLRHHPAFKYYSKQKYGDENALAEKVNKQLIKEIILAYKQIFAQRLIANYQDANCKDILLGAIIVKDKLMCDFAGSANETTLFNHHYYDGMNGEGAQNYMGMLSGYFYPYMGSPTGFSALVPDFLSNTPFFKMASTQLEELITTRGIGLEFGDQHEFFGNMNHYLKYAENKFGDEKITAKRANVPSRNWPGYGVGIMSVGANGKRLQTSLHYSKATGHNGQDMLGMSAFFDGVPVLRPGGYAPWWSMAMQREVELMRKMNFPNKPIWENMDKGFGSHSWKLNHNSVRQNALTVNDVGTGLGWDDNRGSSECVAFKGGAVGSDDAVFQVLEAREFGSFDMVKLPGVSNFRRAFIGVETQDRSGYVVDILSVNGGKTHTLYYSACGERTGDTLPPANKTFDNLPAAGFKPAIITDKADPDNIALSQVVKVKEHGVMDKSASVSFLTDMFRFSKLPDGKTETRANGEDFAKVKMNIRHLPLTGGTNLFSAKSPWWSNAFYFALPGGEQLHGKVVGFEDAIDFLIQRRTGENLHSRFVNIIDGAKLKADSPVTSVKNVLETGDATVIQVSTKDGNTDTIFYQTKNQKITVPALGMTDANYALIRRDSKGAVLRMHMVGGTVLEADGQKLTGAGEYRGTLVDLIGDISGDRKQSVMIVKPEGVWSKAAVEGQQIMVEVTREGKQYHKNYECYVIGSVEKMADGNLKITMANPVQFIAGYHQVMKFDSSKPNFLITGTPMCAYSNQPYYEGLKIYFPGIKKYYTIKDTDAFAGGGGGCRLTLVEGSNPAADGVKPGDWYIIENLRPGLNVKVIDSKYVVNPVGKLAAEVKDESAAALWKYDKTNFEVGDIYNQKWLVSGLDGQVTANGFMIKKSATKDGGALMRYVELNKDYPYLCFQILKAESKGGYCAMTIPVVAGLEAPLPNFVSKILPGYYSFKGGIPKDVKNTTCRVDAYGCDIEYAFIGMFDKPEYIVYTNDAAVKPGDELVVSFDSLQPVESVAVEFYQAYTMPQLTVNGKSKVELAPVNAEKTKWQIKLKLASIGNSMAAKPFAPGEMVLKAVVNNKINVFGSNSAIINVN